MIAQVFRTLDSIFVERKAIDGFQGYSVDSLGRVFNAKGKELKAWKHEGAWNIYKRVGLYNSKGKKKLMLVHRIVAKAFLERPYGKNQVHHIDGNPFNNNVSNLAWVTNLENAHARDEAAF